MFSLQLILLLALTFVPAAVSAQAAAAAPSVSTPAAAAVPPAPVPDQAPPVPSVTAQAAAAVPGGRVLGVDEAVREALLHQPNIRQARAATQAASGRYEQARAGLLPQITASASYQMIHGTLSRVSSAATGGLPASSAAPANGATYELMSTGVSASQLIWDFGQTWQRKRAAERTVDATEAAERETENQLVLDVRRAFFAARAQRALAHVAEETLANERKHLQQIQSFVAVGTRPEIDLAQAQANIANEQVTLINAQNAYATAKSQLNQAMGVHAPTRFEVADDELPAIDGEDADVEILTQRAIANRPQLVNLMRQREAQELTISSIKGAYGPTLSASAGAFEAGRSLDALGVSWNIGATLAWPLFSGGITNGQLHEAQANRDNIDAQLEAAELQIRFDVEQAQLALGASKAVVDAAGVAVGAARVQLQLAEGRYGSGVGSSIELTDAQTALAGAEGQLVFAQFNISGARAQLLAALGQW